MSEPYRIEDEPSPGPWASWAVNPVWPLFAVMFGGVALAWPWFVFNGFAVGSPSRWRETALAVAGLAGSTGIVALLFALDASGKLTVLGLRYALIGLTVWKIGVCYWLQVLQTRSFHLYEHFGGRIRNGAVGVILGAILLPRAISQAPAFWQYVLR